MLPRARRGPQVRAEQEGDLGRAVRGLVGADHPQGDPAPRGVLRKLHLHHRALHDEPGAGQCALGVRGRRGGTGLQVPGVGALGRRRTAPVVRAGAALRHQPAEAQGQADGGGTGERAERDPQGPAGTTGA
ncbi:hypothetical protein, partial [Streptomyces tricolor]|uniref:hypothetical protein n=1 Tax=Streptomyces tricolor TaxID=68277 RepID=UPI001ABEFECB